MKNMMLLILPILLLVSCEDEKNDIKSPIGNWVVVHKVSGTTIRDTDYNGDGLNNDVYYKITDNEWFQYIWEVDYGWYDPVLEIEINGDKIELIGNDEIPYIQFDYNDGNLILEVGDDTITCEQYEGTLPNPEWDL